MLCTPGRKKHIAAVFAIFMLFSVSVATLSDNTEASVVPATEDASGKVMADSYDCERIVTVGVGTLRWVSYFGYENRVVCIDAGDANKSSWNGKAYRSLLNIPPELVSGISGSACKPLESDYTAYGISVHDHNGFGTDNLEEIKKWSGDNIPTVMVVSKSVYDGFSAEQKSGIQSVMAMVVIHEVNGFFKEDFVLSDEFQGNLAVLSKLFDDVKRANELEKAINDIVKDIRGLVDGRKCKFGNAYVGGTSQSGSKPLTWSVGSYVPFQIAGVVNSFDGNGSTTASDGGSEILSSATPSVIFIDLSSGNNILSDSSAGVLKYAELKHVPIYTLLPYFWFGYNFDNALADAYFLVYSCYDGVLTYEECIGKIAGVYEKFHPNMKDGNKALEGFGEYYRNLKSGLTFDGQARLYNGTEFAVTERPDGDAGTAENAGSGNGSAIIVVTAVAAALLVGTAFVLLRKR